MFKSRIVRPVALAAVLSATAVSIASPADAQIDREATIRREGHEAAAAEYNRIGDSIAADDRSRADQAANAQAMQDQIHADFQRARAAEMRRNARWQTKPNRAQEAWKAKNQSEWEQRDREAAARP